ncbi:hypothetical protein FRC02_010611 [Tulasnella sp. 418]|nr:hypothetical protein FRC02_010611 [Tulasnella sp. 418]
MFKFARKKTSNVVPTPAPPPPVPRAPAVDEELQPPPLYARFARASGSFDSLHLSPNLHPAALAAMKSSENLRNGSESRPISRVYASENTSVTRFGGGPEYSPKPTRHDKSTSNDEPVKPKTLRSRSSLASESRPSISGPAPLASGRSASTASSKPPTHSRRPSASSNDYDQPPSTTNSVMSRIRKLSLTKRDKPEPVVSSHAPHPPSAMNAGSSFTRVNSIPNAAPAPAPKPEPISREAPPSNSRMVRQQSAVSSSSQVSRAKDKDLPAPPPPPPKEESVPLRPVLPSTYLAVDPPIPTSVSPKASPISPAVSRQPSSAQISPTTPQRSHPNGDYFHQSSPVKTESPRKSSLPNTPQRAFPTKDHLNEIETPKTASSRKLPSTPPVSLPAPISAAAKAMRRRSAEFGTYDIDAARREREKMLNVVSTIEREKMREIRRREKEKRRAAAEAESEARFANAAASKKKSVWDEEQDDTPTPKAVPQELPPKPIMTSKPIRIISRSKGKEIIYTPPVPQGRDFSELEEAALAAPTPAPRPSPPSKKSTSSSVASESAIPVRTSRALPAIPVPEAKKSLPPPPPPQPSPPPLEPSSSPEKNTIPIPITTAEPIPIEETSPSSSIVSTVSSILPAASQPSSSSSRQSPEPPNDDGPSDDKEDTPRGSKPSEEIVDDIVETNSPRDVPEEPSGTTSSNNINNEVEINLNSQDHHVSDPTPVKSPPTPQPPEEPTTEDMLLAAILPYFSFRELLPLLSLSKTAKRAMEETRDIKELILEKYLGASIGYERWSAERMGRRGEPLSLTLRDLNSYMRGISVPPHHYGSVGDAFLSALASSTTPSPEGGKSSVPKSLTNQVRMMASSTRAYTKVVMRLRAQAEAVAAHCPPPPLPSSSSTLSVATNGMDKGKMPRGKEKMPATGPGTHPPTKTPGCNPQKRSASPAFSFASSTGYGGSNYPYQQRFGSEVSLVSSNGRTSATGVNQYGVSIIPGKFKSPLYRSGHAPLLRVFVPSPDGAWLSDQSVIECERELKRAGVMSLLKIGDIVWDIAAGEDANTGRMVWDGNYLIDLDYTFSPTGEIPRYVDSLAFSPSYWHKIIRSNGNPICHIDLAPFAVEIANNLQLLQDRVQTET